MAGTGTVLSAGCTSRSSQYPQIETRGACLPDETWNKTKPFILTGLGVILTATGIALIANDEPSTRYPNLPTQPTKSHPTTDSGCKDSTFCY